MSLSLSPNSLYRQTTDCTEGGGLTREHCILKVIRLSQSPVQFHYAVSQSCCYLILHDHIFMIDTFTDGKTGGDKPSNEKTETTDTNDGKTGGDKHTIQMTETTGNTNGKLEVMNPPMKGLKQQELLKVNWR